MSSSRHNLTRNAGAAKTHLDAIAGRAAVPLMKLGSNTHITLLPALMSESQEN